MALPAPSYSIFLHVLIHGPCEQKTIAATLVRVELWVAALQHSLSVLGKYTPAQTGDGTLVDVQVPVCAKLLDVKDARVAAQASQEGAEGTKNMKARLGRSV